MEKQSNSLQVLKIVDVACIFALIGFGYAISLTIA